MLNNNINSYYQCLKSKIIVSYCSTMIVEMKSLNKKAFYISPNKRNSEYLSWAMNKDHDDLLIGNYSKFRKIIYNNLNNQKIFTNSNKIDYKYCLQSKNYSKNLLKYFSSI